MFIAGLITARSQWGVGGTKALIRVFKVCTQHKFNATVTLEWSETAVPPKLFKLCAMNLQSLHLKWLLGGVSLTAK